MIHSIRSKILDRLVLRPSTHPIDPGQQTRVEFETSFGTGECFEDTQCNGPQHDRSDGDRLLVLKFPGTSGRAERSSLFPLSYLPNICGSVVTWNPPGYGKSQGKASLESMASAAVEFVQHALSRHQASSPGSASPSVWLVGNSLGCCTAMHIASHEEFSTIIQGLMIRNPPQIDEAVLRIARRYRLGALTGPVARSLPDSMNALQTARRALCPTLLLQSEFDTLVPPEIQDKVFAAMVAPRAKFVLRGIDHGGIISEDDEPGLRERIEWLWNHRTPSNLSSQ